MDMQIIITNPTESVLVAIAAMLKWEATHDEAQEAPAENEPDSSKITRYNYLDLEYDAQVHWKGTKYEFDGAVIEVQSYLDADKIIFLRAHGSGKKVSLTRADLDSGSLTLI